ncbi:hypothetical protein CR513_42204, partial [Mucuna pruriens]
MHLYEGIQKKPWDIIYIILLRTKCLLREEMYFLKKNSSPKELVGRKYNFKKFMYHKTIMSLWMMYYPWIDMSL